MKRNRWAFLADGVRFRPALTPLEISVLPAAERRDGAALRHAVRTQARTFARAAAPQRQKIWVR